MMLYSYYRRTTETVRFDESAATGSCDRELSHQCGREREREREDSSSEELCASTVHRRSPDFSTHRATQCISLEFYSDYYYVQIVVRGNLVSSNSHRVAPFSFIKQISNDVPLC